MKREAISEDEELVAIVENNSCAGGRHTGYDRMHLWEGNLIFRDYGKQAYTFLRRPSGEAIRISIDFAAPQETEEEKEMWKRYFQGIVLRKSSGRAQPKAKKTKAILDASEDELLKGHKGERTPPV